MSFTPIIEFLSLTYNGCGDEIKETQECNLSVVLHFTDPTYTRPESSGDRCVRRQCSNLFLRQLVVNGSTIDTDGVLFLPNLLPSSVVNLHHRHFPKPQLPSQGGLRYHFRLKYKDSDVPKLSLDFRLDQQLPNPRSLLRSFVT